MSAGTEEAKATFVTSVQGAADLIAIHKELNPRPGRRHGPELTLNRSAIVLAVAAWQSYVEELTLAVLDASTPPAGSPLSASYAVITANVRNRVETLSTPNSQNVLALLALAGFDPRPSWSLNFDWERQRSTRYMSLRSRASVSASGAAAEIDGWLKVRNVVAHGGRLQSGQPYSSLITGSAAGRPVVLRRDADRCVAFFRELVSQTATYAQAQFP
jgi:hypothetical protein